jgi:hypothetical protein
MTNYFGTGKNSQDITSYLALGTDSYVSRTNDLDLGPITFGLVPMKLNTG